MQINLVLQVITARGKSLMLYIIWEVYYKVERSEHRKLPYIFRVKYSVVLYMQEKCAGLYSL
jgi:hypothetical protein